MLSSTRLSILSGLLTIVLTVHFFQRISEPEPTVVIASGEYSAKAHERFTKEPQLTPLVRDEQSATQANIDLTAALASLRQEVETLRRQVIAHATEMQAMQAQWTSETAIANESYDAELDTEFLHAQAEEEHLIAQEQDLELGEMRAQSNQEEFAAETTDEVWSQQASVFLQDVFASSELQGTFVDGITCKSTLCRIDVAHDDIAQRADFEIKFPLLITEKFPSVAMQANDAGEGSSTTVAYLVREGFALPQDDVNYEH